LDLKNQTTTNAKPKKDTGKLTTANKSNLSVSSDTSLQKNSLKQFYSSKHIGSDANSTRSNLIDRSSLVKKRQSSSDVKNKVRFNNLSNSTIKDNVKRPVSINLKQDNKSSNSGSKMRLNKIPKPHETTISLDSETPISTYRRGERKSLTKTPSKTRRIDAEINLNEISNYSKSK
jgi:hypothetical protein